MAFILSNIEFYTYEAEIWMRSGDGSTSKLTENDRDVIDAMIERIETFYPRAYTALCDAYKPSKLNHMYFRFRLVSRFIRCNFSRLDTLPAMKFTWRFADNHPRNLNNNFNGIVPPRQDVFTPQFTDQYD